MPHRLGRGAVAALQAIVRARQRCDEAAVRRQLDRLHLLVHPLRSGAHRRRRIPAPFGRPSLSVARRRPRHYAYAVLPEIGCTWQRTRRHGSGASTRGLPIPATIHTPISALSIRPSCMPRRCSFPKRQLMAFRHQGSQKYVYGTHGTPTTDALGAAVDELEGSAGTVAVPSGLAAVVLPLFAFLSAGDHALSSIRSIRRRAGSATPR